MVEERALDQSRGAGSLLRQASRPGALGRWCADVRRPLSGGFALSGCSGHPSSAKDRERPGAPTEPMLSADELLTVFDALPVLRDGATAAVAAADTVRRWMAANPALARRAPADEVLGRY